MNQFAANESAERRKIRFEIRLNPVTKKNSLVLAKIGKKYTILPSKAFAAYERNASVFLPHVYPPISEPVEITCRFYMKTRRKVDLTNLLEAVDDILVTYRVLADDNSQIIVSHDGSRVFHDPKKPRTEVIIRFLETRKMKEPSQ